MSDPNSQLLEALGLTQSKYRSLGDDEKQSVQQLQDILNRLNGDSLNSALSNISAARIVGAPGGGQAISKEGLRGLIAQVSTIKPTPPVAPNRIVAAQQAVDAGSPGGETSVTPTPQVADPTDDQWAQLDSLAGLSPGGSKASYQAMVNSYQRAAMRKRAARDSRDIGVPYSKQPPTAASFFNAQSQIIKKSAELGIDLLTQQWHQKHPGENPPPGLINMWVQTLVADPNLQKQLAYWKSGFDSAQKTGNDYLFQGSLSQLLSGLDTKTTEYLALHPLASQANTDLISATLANRQAWQKVFGVGSMGPANIGSMNQEQLTQAMNATPYMNGMTYGQYTEAKSAMTSQWNAAFGVDPTPGQIAWGVGKSSDEIKQHINAQPSRIGGWNYGTYSSVITAGDKMSNDFFGHPLDDALLHEFSQQFNPAPKPATPAPVKP